MFFLCIRDFLGVLAPLQGRLQTVRHFTNTANGTLITALATGGVWYSSGVDTSSASQSEAQCSPAMWREDQALVWANDVFLDEDGAGIFPHV